MKHIQFLTTEKMGAGSGKDSGKESSGYPKDDSEGTSLQAVKRDSLPAFDEPVKDDREESVKDSPSDAKEKERENTEEEEEVSQTVLLKKTKNKRKGLEKKSATCEARTHDLQIMRLTRCRLRQGGTRCGLLTYDILSYYFPAGRRC